MTPQSELSQPQFDSPWPHRFAVGLVCGTFLLICVGELLTTQQAGMAIPDWPSTHGYNLLLFPWWTWISGPGEILLGHGHRLLGVLVGLMSIALTVAIWLRDSRVWMRLVAVAGLAVLIVQGVLGGQRVLQDSVLLANLHGCLGPAFFAICVAIAVFASGRWKDASPVNLRCGAGWLRYLAVATTCFAYVQLVLGVQLRQVPVYADVGAFRGALFLHLFAAAVLTVQIVLLAMGVLRRHRDEAGLLWPALGLSVLITLQLLLGAGTWVVQYSWPSWMSGYRWTAAYTIQAGGTLQTLTVTAHAVTGSLILVTALLLALRKK